MNDVNSYAYQNRVLLAQISQMLAQNMAMYQSASTPYVNSTYRLPMGMSHPTLFNQLQGAVSSVMGEEIGGFMGLLANPAIRAMLPAPVNDTLSTLMNVPQIGGVNDPAAFMLNRVAQGIGRGVPTINVPFDFTNIQSTDAYIAQTQAFADYAGQLGFDSGSPTAVEALSMDQRKQNLNRIIAARNAIRVQRENSSFGNTFELFNAMNIFGPAVDTDKLMTDLGSIQDESQAVKFLEQSQNKDRVSALLSKAEQASGLMSVAEYFSGFMGANAAENTAMKTFGDAIRDTLGIGNNVKTFIPGVSQAMASIGGLNAAMAVGEKGENMPIANILAARISSAVDSDTRNPNGNFETIRNMGFRRTQDLISTLSNSGMISTGGVDVYGSISQDDVKKMEEAMLRQLEGFGQIAETGKRLGLRTEELIQNLQAMYGGRTNEVLNTKANDIMRELETNVTGGVAEADRLIEEENRRRAGTGQNAITGDDERRSFLRLEAQRRAGKELGRELAETVELGKMAGIDARGVMAMTTTATQILENMGMTGEGSLALTQQGLTYSAMSRNVGGTPITGAQGMAMAAGAMAVAKDDPAIKAYTVLRLAIEQGRVNKDDPNAQALLKKFESGKPLEESEVASIVGADAYRAYSAETDQHIAKYTTEILAYKARDAETFYKNKVTQFAGESGAEILDTLGDNFIVAINDIQTSSRKGEKVEDIKANIMKTYNLDEEQAQNVISAALTRGAGVAGLPEGFQSIGGLEVLVGQLAFSQKEGFDVATSARIFASANVEFSERLYKQLNAGGNINKNLKERFDAMRKEKVKKLIEANPNMTPDQAEAKVNEEGFTFDEYIQGFSGLANAEARQELDKLKASVEVELGSTNNKERKAQLNNMLGLIDAAKRQFDLKKPTTPAAPDGTKETPPTATDSATDAESGQKSTESKDTAGATDSAKDTGTVADPKAGGTTTATDPNAGSKGSSSSGDKPLTSNDLKDLLKTLNDIGKELHGIKEAAKSIEDRILLSGI